MRLPLYAVSFLAGCSTLQLFHHLPAIQWLLLLPLLLVAMYFLPARLPQAALTLAAGFLWSLLAAHVYAQHVVSEALAGEPVWVEGVVSSIPEHDGRVQRFELVLERLQSAGAYDTPQRLRLSWYDGEQQPRAGERWRLQVKLRPPHGFMNPGGFDYEKWLYQRGIHGTGYVRNGAANQRLAAASWYSIDALRQRIAETLLQSKQPFTGLWPALAVGYRGALDNDQWQLLTRTGTNHLMAISGLHIGLVAGLVFWLTRRLLPLAVLRRCPADVAAAVLALIAALGYALLAGMAVPAQRALLMLAVVLGAVILRKPVRPGQSLSLALLIVLLVDPRSVLSAGFWFSFLAVAVIAYSVSARLAPEANWRQILRIQWVIALLLFPLSLFLFQQGSLAAPVANLIAVPLVSLLVVPLVLLALPLLMWAPAISEPLLYLAGQVVAPLWWLLERLAAQPWASWQQDWSSLPLLLLAMAGVVLLLAPRGVPQRWLGALLILPGMLAEPQRPQAGEFWLTLLDVGQGLSVYVETHQHSLLFDTGARFSRQFDVGDRVVVPFLHSRRLPALDKLVISHGDNDHMGGADAIMDQFPVLAVEGQDLHKLRHAGGESCAAGKSWDWDGVRFEYLHPDRDYVKTNNHACVLHVASDAHGLLIAADIEALVEQRLLASQPQRLPADVLIVAHHGSKTSSGDAWIDAVNPRYALVSAGYRNRFGHPAPSVVQRYRQRHIRLLNTADSGAIAIKFADGEQELRASAYRDEQGRYWHHWTLR